MKQNLALFNIIYIIPLIVLLVYPLCVDSSPYLKLGLINEKDWMEYRWAIAAMYYFKIPALTAGYYFQIAALIITHLTAIKAGENGQFIRLLAFAATMLLLVVTILLGVLPIDIAMTTTLVVTAIVSSYAASRFVSCMLNNDTGKNISGENSLKKLRSINLLSSLINVLVLLSIFKFGASYFQSDLINLYLYEYSVLNLLPMLLILLLMPTAMVLFCWRFVWLSVLTSLLVTVFLCIDCWAIYKLYLSAEYGLKSIDAYSIAMIQQYAIRKFCFLTIMFSMVILIAYLAKKADHNRVPSAIKILISPPIFSFSASFALIIPSAASVILCGLINYGSSQGQMPVEYKPLPPEVKFQALNIGFYSAEFPVGATISKWVTGIKNNGLAISIEEFSFLSEETADKEYQDVIQTASSGNVINPLDEKVDLIFFKAYSPFLCFDYSGFTLYLRHDGGFMTISSNGELEQFLSEVKSFLAAYHWGGQNELGIDKYATQLGQIEPEQYPLSALSSSVSLSYQFVEKSSAGECIFQIYLNKKQSNYSGYGIQSPVGDIAANFITLMRGGEINGYKEGFRSNQRTVAGQKGVEVLNLGNLTEANTAFSSIDFKWYAHEQDHLDERETLYFHYYARSRNLKKADEELWFSLWDEYLRRFRAN